MSQIMRIAGIGIMIVAAAALLSACGSSTENSKTAYNAATGNHTVAWKWAEHPDKARADLNVCKECHGQDLDGGIAKVACGTCHVNGITAMTGCGSCHQVPPAGTAAPDRRGAHLVH